MQQAVERLIGLFNLEQLEENLFRAWGHDNGNSAIFGGIVAGQALLAASKTVPEHRPVHSLHAYFLRAGDVNSPVVYDVERIRDGRSFATRRVKAIQHGRPIFSLAASFQEAESGPQHQRDMPAVPNADDVPSDDQARKAIAATMPAERQALFTRPRPVVFHPVTPKNGFVTEPSEPVRNVWFKLADKVDVPQGVHRALLAYCSDFGLMTTAMQPHGLSFWQPDVQCASIDHAMWFHNDVAVDDWLLYHCESPFSGGGRGMNFGAIYAADGTLVASVAQEGLMRQRSAR